MGTTGTETSKQIPIVSTRTIRSHVILFLICSIDGKYWHYNCANSDDIINFILLFITVIFIYLYLLALNFQPFIIIQVLYSVKESWIQWGDPENCSLFNFLLKINIL